MKFTEKTQSLIDALYQNRKHAELSIGILKDGEIASVHFNDAEKEVPEKLIYPVGSIGKTFTASLLAKHIAEGSVRLEDSIYNYLPELPDGYYPSVMRMATHHSGYGGAPHGTLETLRLFLGMNRETGILHVNPYRGYPDEEKMYEVLRNKKLKDKEYKFVYSNFAYGVLGYILGKLEKTDYYGAMESYFHELGLKNTSLKNSQMIGYDRKGNPCRPWQWEREDIVAPAGAMLSTVDDLLEYANVNLDGSHPYLDLCHRIHASGDKNFDQGLAWRIKKNTEISYHAGNAGAFSCVLALDRKKKTAAAVALNYALVDLEPLVFTLLEEL